jgi:hypothetical protein
LWSAYRIGGPLTPTERPAFNTTDARAKNLFCGADTGPTVAKEGMTPKLPLVKKSDVVRIVVEVQRMNHRVQCHN